MCSVPEALMKGQRRTSSVSFPRGRRDKIWSRLEPGLPMELRFQFLGTWLFPLKKTGAISLKDVWVLSLWYIWDILCLSVYHCLISFQMTLSHCMIAFCWPVSQYPPVNPKMLFLINLLSIDFQTLAFLSSLLLISPSSLLSETCHLRMTRWSKSVM